MPALPEPQGLPTQNGRGLPSQSHGAWKHAIKPAGSCRMLDAVACPARASKPTRIRTTEACPVRAMGPAPSVQWGLPCETSGCLVPVAGPAYSQLVRVAEQLKEEG